MDTFLRLLKNYNVSETGPASVIRRTAHGCVHCKKLISIPGLTLSNYHLMMEGESVSETLRIF
jgi:hypothetical protein